jgi:hypothetical protein
MGDFIVTQVVWKSFIAFSKLKLQITDNPGFYVGNEY